MLGRNVENQVVQNAVQNSGVQNVRNQNGLIVVSRIANQNRNGNVVAARAEGNTIGNSGNQIRCYNCRGLGHLARNCTARPRRRDAAYLQTQLLIAQKEEAGIKEFNLMAAAADLDEIEEVNANCILMANLKQALTSGTQSDKAPVYDSDRSAEYTELLEPIPKPHQVSLNDSNVIYEVSSVEQAVEVEKVNTVNCKMKETNAELTIELARYKNQEKCFEISQEKYDKLERCYQLSVYQEQCLTKKINALHLSSGKQITALNEEISNLNKQLSKKKPTVSSLQEEKKRLKSIFKIREDEFLDKQIQENKIKELDNILVKTEAAKFVRDFQSLAKEADESLAKHKALEWEIKRLLRAVVSEDIMSIVQNNSVADASNLQTELECMKESFENCIIKKENEFLNKKDTTKGTSTNTKLANQSTERKPFLQSLRNTFVARQPNAFQSECPNFSKSRVPQKVDKTTDLSNPVTSNSVPTTKESKVVENDKVIALGMFRITPFKNSREERFVPNKPIKASVRTNPIIVPQPYVITKKVVNSDSNGFSSTGVDITTKTRRPQPRSNTKNDRVPSAPKSSRIKNKEVEVEEHPRNLLISKNKKHMSSECNNVKLAI
ncbi:retrovirus-related pol polyprotein from transposon TNT 1-94 [Tanacetum coccineum]